MTLRWCDGPTFLRAVVAAVATLDRHAAEVDSLNVFPVPDGDTGRNMLLTMRGALAQATDLGPERRSLTSVADAIAQGALMSARGNSGVILSQLLQGVADGVRGRRHADAPTLAGALRCGSRAADAAVRPPVEGTILSVARAAAEAASGASDGDASLQRMLAAAVEAAARAVARTPDQLPVLADAGVVDAGGRGLELLLRGALLGTAEASTAEATAVEVAWPASRQADLEHPGPPPGGWGYETMYLVAAHAGAALDLDAMRSELAGLGESVLVVGDERVARVHLHSHRPDLALGHGLVRGTLSRVTVENLDLLSAGEREERAAELLGMDVPATPASTNLAAARSPEHAAAPTTGGAAEVPLAAFAIVAVAVGEGIARAFRAAGARPLVPDGGGLAASTGELLAAIEAARAHAVVVLPNHADVRLAAEQAKSLAAGMEVHVVPTRNAAEGLAAVLAVDPRADAAANAGRMSRAAATVRSFVVTTAVRDARLDGRPVRKGHAIALDADGALIAAGVDRVDVALAATRTVVETQELLTIHAGADAREGEVERLAREVAAALPDLVVEVVDGGQPHHAFLVAAE